MDITKRVYVPGLPSAFLERLHNLYDVYFADRGAREIRHTAIGWKPGDDWKEEKGATPSGNREYYRVIRKGGHDVL